MEKSSRVSGEIIQLSKSAYEGLEFIRRSKAIEMSNRQTVLELAREWGLSDTADWLESVNDDAYGLLIQKGPDVIGTESLDEKLDRMDREYDEERRGFWEGKE